MSHEPSSGSGRSSRNRQGDHNVEFHMTDAPGEVQFDIGALMRSGSEDSDEVSVDRPDLLLTPAPMKSPTKKSSLNTNTTPRYAYRNSSTFSAPTLTRTPQPSPAVPNGRANHSYSQHFNQAVNQSFQTVSLPPTPRHATSSPNPYANNGHHVQDRDSHSPAFRTHSSLDNAKDDSGQQSRRDSQDSNDGRPRTNPYSRNSNPQLFNRRDSASSTTSHVPQAVLHEADNTTPRGSVILVSRNSRSMPLPVARLQDGQSQIVFEVGDEDVDLVEVKDEHLAEEDDDVAETALPVHTARGERSRRGKEDRVSRGGRTGGGDHYQQRTSSRHNADPMSPSRGERGSSRPPPPYLTTSRTSSRTSSRTRSREHQRPLKHAFPGFETMKITVVYEPYKTGFESSKDFQGRVGDLIAGRYKILDEIGHAQFSNAVSCLDVTCNRKVALKIIKNDKEYVDQSLDEIKILELLNSRDRYNEYHIVQLEDYFYFKEHLFLVFELLSHNLYEYSRLQKQNERRRRSSISAMDNSSYGMDSGSSGRRNSVIQSGGSVFFTLNQLADITVQLLEALEFVHSFDIIHCDLKPENILVERIEENKIPFDGYSSSSSSTTQGGYDSSSSSSSYQGRSAQFAHDQEQFYIEQEVRRKFHVKLIDFGGSCFIHDYLSSYVQSRSYRAPECIVGAPYSKGIDMWSLGCVLFELYTGVVLFSNRPIPHVLNKMVSLLGPLPDDLIRNGKHSQKYFKSQRRRASVHGSSDKKSNSGRLNVSANRLMKPSDRSSNKIFSNGPPKSTGGWLSDDEDDDGMEQNKQRNNQDGRAARHRGRSRHSKYSESSESVNSTAGEDSDDSFRGGGRNNSRSDRSMGRTPTGLHSNLSGNRTSRWAIFERVPMSGSEEVVSEVEQEGGARRKGGHGSKVSSVNEEMRFLRPTPTSLEEKLQDAFARDSTAQPHNTMLFVHFLKQLLEYDQNKRLTSSAALQHPFVMQWLDSVARANRSHGKDRSRP